MLVSSAQSLTPSEAASVTGVPLKQVHRIIDAGLMQGFVRKERGSRLIALPALIGLRLAYLTAAALTPATRQRILEKVLSDVTRTVVEEAPLMVDLQPVIREVEAGLERLERARQAVKSDPAIRGGEPVLIGTRVAVHDIADMLDAGESAQAVAAAYQHLTPDQIALASEYATAYPRRGRPRAKPTWRAKPPKSSRTIKIDDLPVVS